ncbi:MULTISPECIES: LysE family translocator [unclassified Pseudomonas]|uniref:LysE family translocator n=1 Tax=unclassified Pseudomonas TaxID=196821 RepID=UPI0013653B3F|nr:MULTISPECIES: LysE family translocator [unclassified Pseudomonas]
MNTALTATYILTVMLLIATPGPVVALVVATASVAGPRKALSTAIGTNWASLVLIALASYIILTSAAINIILLNILSLMGCLFIGYLALDTLKSLPASAGTETPVENAAHGGLWRGFIVGISNPKDIIFFISFFPQFIQVTSSSRHSLLLLSLLWVVIDLLILGTYIFITRKLLNDTNKQLISKCSGVALLLVALLGLIYNVRELLLQPAVG